VDREQSQMVHGGLLLFVLAVFIWSIIKPAIFSLWILEVLPAVVLLIVVIAVYNRFRFTTLSYFIIAMLSILMFIGGHYTYSKVPLFNWIKDVLELHRNHYDRFGHFLKGLLVIVIRELLLRKTPLKKGKWLFFISVSIILAISALYEIIEWLAFVIGKKGITTENFLGAQGDRWDAQWDMLLAFLGSILGLMVLSRWQNDQLNKLLNKK
jgi:putative membrane protein